MSAVEDSKYPILELFIVLSTLIQVRYAQQGNAHHGGPSLSRENLLALNNRVHNDSDILSNIDFPPGMTKNNTKPLVKEGWCATKTTKNETQAPLCHP